MASHRDQHRRRSMEEPPDMLSDVNDLKKELNKLHEKISPKCQEHIKKMNTLVNDFKEDYRHTRQAFIRAAITVGLGGVAVILGLALSSFTMGISTIAAGIGGAVAAGGGVALAIGQFKKTQQKKNLRKSFEDQLTELQTKISPVIDVLKQIFLRVQNIMRNHKLSEHQAIAMRECFSYCFENIQLFRVDDNREVGPPMNENLTGELSKTLDKISSMLDLLDEILEDDDEGQNDNDRPADSTTEKEMEKEFKEKAEKFIDEMKKGINQLENFMNKIDRIKTRLSNAI